MSRKLIASFHVENSSLIFLTGRLANMWKNVDLGAFEFSKKKKRRQEPIIVLTTSPTETNMLFSISDFVIFALFEIELFYAIMVSCWP